MPKLLGYRAMSSLHNTGMFDFEELEQTLVCSEGKEVSIFCAPMDESVPIRCVMFDMFGTLVRMTKRQLPWTRLFAQIAEE